MEDTERTVKVTVSTMDRVSSYDFRSRASAERSFPIDANPSTIAAWAGRTFMGQRADAETAYPLPKPVEPEQDPALAAAQRLEAIATAPTDEAAEAVVDVADLPF